MPFTKYLGSGKAARRRPRPVTFIRKDGKEIAVITTSCGAKILLDKDEAQALRELGWLTEVHMNGRGNRYPHHRIIQRREGGTYGRFKGTLARRMSALAMVLEARAQGLNSSARKGWRSRLGDGNPLNLTKANRKVEWRKDRPESRPFRNGYWDVAEAERLMRLLDAGLDPREETERAYREQRTAKRAKKEGKDGV